MSVARVLVIDDEEVVRQLLDRTLTGKDYFVETVEDGSEALEKINNNTFDLLITDLKMPRVDGMEVLRELKKVNPYAEVIIITGYPTIELAVEAIKIGAFDFICKPFDIEEILLVIARSLEKQRFNLAHFQLSEIKTLFEANKAITAAPNLNDLLTRILGSALEIAKAKRGCIMLVDEQAQELRIKVAYGVSQELIDTTRIKIGEGVFGRVAREGIPLLLNKTEEVRRFQKENYPQYESEPFLGIPLTSIPIRSQRNILGVINISDKISGDSFTEREKTLLSVLAGQTAVAIENANLYSELQHKIEDLKQTINKLHYTQNQLIQTEKLAAVGRLAFGIAHEIRNPLGIILIGTEFLENSAVNKKDKFARDSIKKIKQSVNRANNIIIELLKFSGTSQLKLQLVNVCKITDDALSLIKNRAYLHNVQIERNYTEKDFPVKANPTMLRQVFFNLCINAIDAMPQGGKLYVNVYTEKIEKADNKKITVEIVDTGKGIPRDILSKIFDPFFTMKEPGKGTGLGLSIVHLILERHKATIEVESQLDKGTKFIIRLPAGKK
jgi:signal transduction histidine kinase/FixJ family two-component response regulator